MRGRTPGSRRRAAGTVFAAILAGGALVAAVAVVGTARPGPAAVDSAASAAAPTTRITRQTLVDAVTVPGRLGYGATQLLDSRATGTVTWLPAIGDVLTRGSALLRADEQPVVVLFGSIPMYRPLRATSQGRDVEQLEANLSALGYAGFGVDEEFTERTAAAVKRWQEDLDLEPTGIVDIARVVYVPGPVRVASLSLRPGASATGEVLACTPDARVVTVDAPAAGAAWASIGTRVSVRLPGGREVGGTVSAVGAEATAASPGGEGQPDAAPSASGTATVPVTVSIADQAGLGRLQSAPVDIVHTARQRKDVLTVPVAALLAPQEGGYGLEVVDEGGSRVIPVTTGLFAAGRVEVSGAGLRAGMSVRMPG